MRRVIYILVIVVVLLALSIFEYVAVANVLNTLKQSVGDIKVEYYKNANDITILQDDIIEIKDYWMDKESTICLMFNHKDLDNISDTLTKLAIYTENNDYYKAIIEINLLDEYMKNSDHIMSFTIHNIL